MQKKLASILFSTRLTAVLFIAFAIAMAVGTFLDRASDTSPTPFSRAIIYNSWWFVGIMVLFVVNFVGNIFRFRLYKKKKWATLTLHLSFILILVGAGVTRYIGYEGLMPIREGATEDTFLSTETYLKAFIDGDYKIDGVAQRRNVPLKELDLSERLSNKFTLKTDYNKQPVIIKYRNFISNVREGFIASEDGEEYLRIVESGEGQGHDHWIKKGEVASIHNILVSLDNPTPNAINITTGENEYKIDAPFEGFYMNMAELRADGVDPTQLQGVDMQEIMRRFQKPFVKDSLQTLALRSLYSMGGMQFVIPEAVSKGRYGPVKVDLPERTNQDVLVVDVQSMGETQTVELIGGKFVTPNPVRVDIAGLKVFLSYGAMELKLPFSITLNDFIADKHPGTDKGYSSFRSKLTVNNSATDFYDYDVFMNNVLDHRGFRFFQASFDPDEKGTVLSVNHDFWGTWITYIGYFLLYFGLMAILFDRNTRFADLKRMLDKVKDKKAKMTTVIVLLFSLASFAQDTSHENRVTFKQIDSVVMATAASKEHAAKFGRLVVQDNGRMKPINTFASEILRKVSGKDTYGKLDANQVFLSMNDIPKLWLEVPIMKLDWRNDSIKRILGVPKEASMASIFDLLDSEMKNKLGPYLKEATSKTNPNQFEKDFIKLNEKSYVLDATLSGGMLKLFPIPGDQNNKWISRPELGSTNIKGQDSVFVSEVLTAYRVALGYAKRTDDYTEADKILDLIVDYQKKYGSDVIPSENKIDAEIMYNKADLFNRLYHYYAMFGAFMFIFVIVQIFTERKWLRIAIKTLKVLFGCCLA